MTSLPPRPRRPFGNAPQPDADTPARPFGIRRNEPQPPPAPAPEQEAPQELPDFLTADDDELEGSADYDFIPEVDGEDGPPLGAQEVEYDAAYVNPQTGYALPVEEVEELESQPAHYIEPVEHEYTAEPEVDEGAVDDLRAELGEESFRAAQELLRLIADDSSTEVLLNGPDNIMFEQNGQSFVMQNISFPDIETYHKVINNFILPYTSTSERIGDASDDPDFLIEGQLILADLDDPENKPPLKARVHIVQPIAGEAAYVTIAKKARRQFTIDELQHGGSMTRQMAEFIKALARGRATVIFSGVSGSGKTTLLEACSYEFDENDRVIVIEDLPELELPLMNVPYLRSSSQKPNQDVTKQVTLDWLVRQANRMRAKRIVVGEVRGPEMADFFSAANSGADGSMTTVHANSPQDTISRMVLLAMRHPGIKDAESVQREIAATVQIIVQMTKIDGQHRLTDIAEVSNIVTKNGSVALQPIYQYDRNHGTWRAAGRPSDGLQAYLAQRGVSVDNSWFLPTR